MMVGGVLILILMEYSLRPEGLCLTITDDIVLILILMEYSLRRFNFVTLSKNIVVLILILMEYSLRPKEDKELLEFYKS